MFFKNKKERYLEKIRAFESIEGWLSLNEAFGLYSIARSLKGFSTIVEIGSWKGKSTYCLAKGLRKGRVVAIDPFNADAGSDTASKEEYRAKKGSSDLLNEFKTNMQSRGVLEKIQVQKGYSHQFEHLIDQIDFLFIDGDHSVEGCKQDFDLYAPKVKPGGYLAFHDYYANRPGLGPTYVVHNIIPLHKEFLFFQLFDSLWVAKKY